MLHGVLGCTQMAATAELPAALNADAIATACEVLRAAVALPVEQYESNPALRPLRQAIGPLLARSLGRTYDGAGPQGKDKDAARKAHRRQANRHRQQAVAAERAAADRSALRAQRLARLAASAAEGGEASEQPTSEGTQPEGQPSGSTVQHETSSASPIVMLALDTSSTESTLLLSHVQLAPDSFAIVVDDSTSEQEKESPPNPARSVSEAKLSRIE